MEFKIRKAASGDLRQPHVPQVPGGDIVGDAAVRNPLCGLHIAVDDVGIGALLGAHHDKCGNDDERGDQDRSAEAHDQALLDTHIFEVHMLRSSYFFPLEFAPADTDDSGTAFERPARRGAGLFSGWPRWFAAGPAPRTGPRRTLAFPTPSLS